MDHLDGSSKLLSTYHDAVQGRIKTREGSKPDVVRRELSICLWHNWYNICGNIIDGVFNDPTFAFYSDLKQTIVKVARDRAIMQNRSLENLQEWLLESTNHPDIEFPSIWEDEGEQNAEFKWLSDFFAMLHDECTFYSWVMGNDRAIPPPQTWYLSEQSYRTEILMELLSMEVGFR